MHHIPVFHFDRLYILIFLSNSSWRQYTALWSMEYICRLIIFKIFLTIFCCDFSSLFIFYPLWSCIGHQRGYSAFYYFLCYCRRFISCVDSDCPYSFCSSDPILLYRCFIHLMECRAVMQICRYDPCV